MTLSSAKIQFNEQGTPVATEFDDVYFSNANGLEETRYVFLKNNALPYRWQQSTRNAFVIAETGFGTGLNFLATLAAFVQFFETNTDTSLHTLYYITTEKFPLNKRDLAEALKSWPELAHFSQQLVSQYPEAIPGCHRMIFAGGRVVLDLWLGDVHETLPQWSNQTTGLVDAWFLDGFAPSKNPDMWTEHLFSQMARLSRQDATFATFTAAGIVKRGLKEVGFDVEKRKGFGHKRDMLAGNYVAQTTHRTTQRYFYRQQARGDQTSKIAIVGGGMAAANMALALAQKGLGCEIYCQDDGLAKGASGNHQGGFYPQLNADPGVNSQIQAGSFRFARNTYNRLIEQGFEYPHQWCGVLQVSFNDNVAARHHNLISKHAWPDELIHPVTAQQGEQLASVELGYPGLFIPDGGWIHPPSLVEQLLAYAHSIQPHTVHFHKQLVALEKRDDHWHMEWSDGSIERAGIVVLACGAHSHRIPELAELSLRQVRGQVELVESEPPYDQLSTVLCHKGYMTPAYNGQHALGSTYVKQDESCEYRAAETQTNLQTHATALDKSPWVAQLAAQQAVSAPSARASVRCSSPDHLPLAGSVPDLAHQKVQYEDLYKALPLEKYPYPEDLTNLYMLTGLGSRGLTTAPLMAEILASQICRHPLPMSEKLLSALNPNRFLIRDLIRRQIR